MPIRHSYCLVSNEVFLILAFFLNLRFRMWHVAPGWHYVYFETKYTVKQLIVISQE